MGSTAGLHPIAAGFSFGRLNDTLLAGEADGLAIDFTATDDFARSTWAMQAVRERNSSVDTLQSPHVFFTQSGTSPKYIKTSATTIGWSPHNTSLRSQELDSTPTWTHNRVTISANATTAPDGTATADKVVEDGNTNSHLLSGPLSTTIVLGFRYTISAYLKAADASWAQLVYPGAQFGTNAWANFNTSTGAVGTVGSEASAGIESIGNGWYRCYVSATCTTAGVNAQPFNLCLTNDTDGGARLPSYAGDSTTGVYVWGCQVNLGYTPTAYIATTTAAKIGLPISYGEGLLVEPAATNLCGRSQEIDNVSAAWTHNSSVIVTANATTAPDGSTTAEKVVSANGSSTSSVTQTLNVTSGTAYTWSVYAKAAEWSWLRFSHGAGGFPDSGRIAWFNLSNGTVGTVEAGVTAAIVSVGNGWYRVSITATADASAGSACGITSTNADNTISTGDGTSGIYVWGAQLETGTVATSYVPTAANSATRAADNITVLTSDIGSYSQTAGTYYQDMVWYGTAAIFWQFDNNASTPADNRIVGYRLLTNPRIFVRAAGSTTADLDIGELTANARNQMTAAWAANDVAGSHDGGAVANDTSVTLPTIDTFRLGKRSDSTDILNGLIRRVVYVPRRVIDADLPTWRYTA